MTNFALGARNGVSYLPDDLASDHFSNASISVAPLAGLRGFEQVFVPHGATLMTQGAKTDYVFYILSGWALEEELTADGDVAWADIMMRGEVAGLNCVVLEPDRRGQHPISTASILALTDVFAVRVPRRKISAHFEEDRAFSKMVHDTLRRQTAHLHSHLVALSAKCAHDRVTMLLQSLYQRAIEARALTGTKRLPISQVILARVANISAVHMNRIAQKLRLDGFLDWTTEGVQLVC
jgi:CRP/FNR family transcriptional regulator, anaerobic regulatory protein